MLEFYRGKENYLYNLILVLVSLCLILVSIFNSYYFMLYFDEFQEKLNLKNLKTFKYVPKLLLGINSILLLLGTFTFLREIYSSFSSSQISEEENLSNLLTI